MSGPPGLLPPTRPERTNETSLHKHGDANLARQICVRSSFDGGGKGRRTYQLVFAYRILVLHILHCARNWKCYKIHIGVKEKANKSSILKETKEYNITEQAETTDLRIAKDKIVQPNSSFSWLCFNETVLVGEEPSTALCVFSSGFARLSCAGGASEHRKETKR